jgi:glycopeptide antibiotics resistance protein
MEILQYIMPYGRMFDIKDMLANTTGAILAYFFIKNAWPSIRSLKRKN